MERGRVWILDELWAFWIKPVTLGLLSIIAFFVLVSAMPPLYLGLTMTRLFGGAGFPDNMGIITVWLPLVFSPLLLSGLYIEEELRRGAYAVLRLKSYRTWWLRKATTIALSVLIYWIVLALLAKFLSMAFGNEQVFYGGETELDMRAFFVGANLMYVNTLLFAFISVLLRAVTGDAKKALLLPIGFMLFTTLIGIIAPQTVAYMPGRWGMVMSSTMIKESFMAQRYGFNVPAVIALEIVIIISICVLAPALLKRSEFAIRK